ncbi:MAG: hypothetical protein V4620_10060 [Bacteroidota bacterium]
MKVGGYSKIIHVIVFATFFLPFFQNGCSPSAEEKVKIEEKRIADSIASATASADSIVTQKPQTLVETTVDSINTNNSTVSTPGHDATQKEKRISVQVAEQFPLLKPLLNPAQDISTGVGTIIDCSPYIMAVCTFLCLLLLLLSFVIKFIDKRALNAILFIELLSLASLYYAIPITWLGERLWGYWFCFYGIIVLVVFDIYVRIKNKKTE